MPRSWFNEAAITGLVFSIFDPKLISLVPETPEVDKLSIENLVVCSQPRFKVANLSVV